MSESTMKLGNRDLILWRANVFLWKIKNPWCCLIRMIWLSSKSKCSRGKSETDENSPFKLSLTQKIFRSSAINYFVGKFLITCLDSTRQTLMENRGRQLKKVVIWTTEIKRFWPQKFSESHDFSYDLNLELSGGLKVRGSEINFIK